jgi:hypothetical protein
MVSERAGEVDVISPPHALGQPLVVSVADNVKAFISWFGKMQLLLCRPREGMMLDLC